MTISNLYIDPAVKKYQLVEEIRSKLKASHVSVAEPRDVFRKISAARDPVRKAKEILYLTQNKGAFIRKCPGTSEYICCGYMILNIGTYCIMDCAYCILQTYFHPPVLQFFVNIDEMLSELKDALAEKQFRRIGTGEFTDSLIWEPWTDLSRKIVPQFARQKYTALELKTKTTAIEALKDIEHNNKTIVSWSLNTPEVIRHQERRTASLDARLNAAAKCQKWGYPLGFHFDPLVLYDGCETEYRNVVDQLFSKIDPDRVVWISLGSFRFMPALKPVVEQRFPNSTIAYGEFIPGLDGKMRYFKPLRIQLYKKLVAYIRNRAPNVPVYFCMEDNEVWKSAVGFEPGERGGLEKILDESVINICNLERSE